MGYGYKWMHICLDDKDHEAVVQAMAKRERDIPMPDGGGNIAGKALGEICRSWMEFRRLDTQGD